MLTVNYIHFSMLCACVLTTLNKKQTTAVISTLHGLSCKAGLKLRFMQHLIGVFFFFFFKVSLLSGRNYNTRPQKRPIQPRVTERAGASFDSYRDKSSLYHSVTQPQIPGQINKMALIQQKQFIKGIFPYVQEKLTHTSVYKFSLSRVSVRS